MKAIFEEGIKIMYLLVQRNSCSRDIREIDVCKKVNGSWQLIQHTQLKGSKALTKWLQNSYFPLDYAIIKLNRIDRNALYYFMPDIKIIIDPNEIIHLFKNQINIEMQGYEEIAATELDKTMSALNIGKESFISAFYNMQQKNEAVHFYELWQRDIPLNDKKLGRIVRVMEFYFDEIVGYFDAPDCIKALRRF